MLTIVSVTIPDDIDSKLLTTHGSCFGMAEEVGLVPGSNILLALRGVSVVEVLELEDRSRRAWRRAGPRPVRTKLWRPGRATGGMALVVLSHGSGGAARNLAWLAEALCAEGYLVAAIDHHGNSCDEELLPEGAAFWWERPADLTFVVDQLQETEHFRGVAVAGYSLGGYTAARGPGCAHR